MSAGRGILIGGALYSQNSWENFTTTLIPSVCNGYTLSASGTGVVTVTTAAPHGMSALVGPVAIDRAGLAPVPQGAVGLQNDPAYSPSQPTGTLLGVILSGVNGVGSTGIINGSYVVTSCPSPTSFTIQLTRAQAAQLAAFASNGTVTPFLVFKPGDWYFGVGPNGVIQSSFIGAVANGGNGPANLVNGVSAGQTFGAITTTPLVWGSGTWVSVPGGTNTYDFDVPTDGRSVQVVFSGAAGTSQFVYYIG